MSGMNWLKLISGLLSLVPGVVSALSDVFASAGHPLFKDDAPKAPPPVNP